MASPLILNLTRVPASMINENIRIVDLPKEKQEYVKELCSSKKPVPPWEIRKRARKLALMIEDQEINKVLLEGPNWILTDLLIELETQGKTAIFAVKEESGTLRVLRGGPN